MRVLSVVLKVLRRILIVLLKLIGLLLVWFIDLIKPPINKPFMPVFETAEAQSVIEEDRPDYSLPDALEDRADEV